MPSVPAKMKVLLTLVENLENRNWTFTVVQYFISKLKLVSNILWVIVSGNLLWFLLTPDPFKLNSFDIFGNSKVFLTVVT